MEAPEPVEPDLAVDVGDGGGEDDLVRDVDAGDVPVARVETQAEPRMVVECGVDGAELVRRAADRCS